MFMLRPKKGLSSPQPGRKGLKQPLQCRIDIKASSHHPDPLTECWSCEFTHAPWTHLEPVFSGASKCSVCYPIERFVETSNHIPTPLYHLLPPASMARPAQLLAAFFAVFASASAASSRFYACKWSDTYKWYRIIGSPGRGQRFVEKVKVSRCLQLLLDKPSAIWQE